MVSQGNQGRTHFCFASMDKPTIYDCVTAQRWKNPILCVGHPRTFLSFCFPRFCSPSIEKSWRDDDDDDNDGNRCEDGNQWNLIWLKLFFSLRMAPPLLTRSLLALCLAACVSAQGNLSSAPAASRRVSLSWGQQKNSPFSEELGCNKETHAVALLFCNSDHCESNSG